MKYQSLEHYISTLSDTEKEQFKYLIDEAGQRASAIEKDCDAMKERIASLFESLSGGGKAMGAFGKQVEQLKANILRLHFRLTYVSFFSAQSNRDLLQHYPESLN